jgi:hypothetical protein
MPWGQGHRGRYCERTEHLILATGRQSLCPAAELDQIIPSGGPELDPETFQWQFTRLNNGRGTGRRIGIGEHHQSKRLPLTTRVRLDRRAPMEREQ